MLSGAPCGVGICAQPEAGVADGALSVDGETGLVGLVAAAIV
jgi:hypothetical protein